SGAGRGRGGGGGARQLDVDGDAGRQRLRGGHGVGDGLAASGDRARGDPVVLDDGGRPAQARTRDREGDGLDGAGGGRLERVRVGDPGGAHLVVGHRPVEVGQRGRMGGGDA